MNIVEALIKISDTYHNKVAKQVRKYSGAPYTVHTNEVREIYASVAPDDLIGQAIAEGHDLFEDTPLTPVELARILSMEYGFPADVIDAVILGIVELTDVYVREKFPTMNRKERKRNERERLGTISTRSKSIKLADFLSNTKDIVKNDPDFARVYLDEKEAALPYLVDGNPELLNRATHQLLDSKKTLGLTIRIVSANL